MANNGEESRSFTYDVFLSFRGEDTRHRFTGTLRNALCRKGINTFIDDDNLRRGEDISPALSKAIDESRISIVVLSENYASSSWCLAELVKILNCMRNNKQLVFPIFYHVEPSDVRYQKNCYGEAMTAHEKRFGKDSEKVQTWRQALFEVANLKGDHISSGRYEVEFIEKIVKDVSVNIPPKPLHTDPNLVGLEPRIEEVKSLLEMKPNDDTVCMLGIYGVGGIGKTALAKALYNKIVHQFEAASFLADVREKSDKINGLEDLQKTLLSEMLEGLETELGCKSKGTYEIQRKLSQKKVLLVLDDVDDIEKLEQLAGGYDWFGSGSRIIITTRDKDLLISHQVVKMYEMTELNDEDSLEVLCWNAFKMSHPRTEYEDVSSRAVGYAKGLPLALKVIGSNLRNRSLDAWECALEEYEKIPHQKIQKVLKKSYDSLEENAKHVFLDIACFFKGERKEYVTKILDACDFHATLYIEVLVDKSLLTVEYGCLKMHDLIQAMGREIVRQEAKSNPGKRSRLWSYKNVLEVLTKNSGSCEIEGIMLDPPQLKEVEWSGTAFKEMNRLRILIIRNTHFLSGPEYLPNYLRLLDWEEYPSKSFPPGFNPTKIVVFILCRSHLTLDEPFKQFSCLTNMNFSHSQSITEMPDVSEVPNLRELRLDNCKKLIKVHESVGFLKKLAHLSASECTKLKDFLPRIFLPSLEVFDLNLCVRLEHFPDIVEKMNKPLKIYMINTAIEKLPDSIGNLIGLDCIEIPSCNKLKNLPSCLFMLPNFVAFKIGGCSQLRESFRRFLESPSAANGRPTLRTLYFGNGGLLDEDLHAVLNCFPQLEELIASENNFVFVPACIKESVNLTSLDVSVCRKLKKIPECTNLRILDVHRCVKLEEISELPPTIQKVDARYCISLSTETSTMLWSQVLKERRGIEIVMPQTEIPEKFDFRGNGGTPLFWARGKFPIVALALVFEDVNEEMAKRAVRRQLVELQLIINGECVPRNGYYSFRIAEDHVLVCDLRVLFSDQEWLGLDAYLEHDWNYVQVSYDASTSLTLSCWAVYVYKQSETNMEDVKFMCPDPKYSNPATFVPVSNHKDRQLIDGMCLDEMLYGMLMETKDYEKRDDFADKDFAVEQLHVLMGGLKEISRQAKEVLEGSELEDEDSLLAWLLRHSKKSDKEGDPAIITHKGLALIRLGEDQKLKAPIELQVGESSSSGHQGSSSEIQGNNDTQLQQILTEMFYDGIVDGLLEAQNSFPTLDIQTTITATLNKGNRFARSLSEVENREGEGILQLPPVEMKIYIDGIACGLLEAKLSFPDLDIQTTLATVLSKGALAHKGIIEAPLLNTGLDWTTVMPPTSAFGGSSVTQHHDPFLQALMMIMKKQESLESEANSKPYWKLKVEHKALRNKFEEFENETAVLEKVGDTANFPSSKNQYDELVEKFNTQSAELISKKASKISDSQFALGSTEMHTDIRKKGVTKYKKLASVWKGRAEELQRLYDTGIEDLQNSEEFEDLMYAIYLDGLRDGLLEAQVSSLAMDMESITPVFQENEEHVIVEASKEEHVIPSPPAPRVHNPGDTSNPSSSDVFLNFQEFLF